MELALGASMVLCLSIAFSSLISIATWPEKSWPVALPHQVGVNEERFEKVLDYIFPLSSAAEGSRAGIRTDGFLVIKDGYLVFEKYQNGFGPSKKHSTWSISKTLAGLLIGIAEKQGRLNRKDLVSKYLPDLAVGSKKEMTIEDLLFWSSSIKWTETYEYLPLFSDVVAMLYTAGFNDMAKYAMSLPLKAKPGDDWYYSSGDSTILMRVLQAAVSDSADFPWKFLFDKLQAGSATFERDGHGTFVGAAGFFSTAQDLARIGYLILRDGKWKKEQILPSDWISSISKPAPAYIKNKIFKDSNQGYGGGQIWLNYLGPAVSDKLRWKDAPPDTIIARGHWGQYLVIIPSLDLVIVRFGDDREKRAFNVNQFLSLIVQSLETTGQKK